MPKSRLRDSLLNMLGEFVALNKTPDYKLNSQSNQYLAEAIREEVEHKRMSTDSLFFSQSQQQQPRHFRTTSTNSGYRGSAAKDGNTAPENDPYYIHGRRQSLPVGGPNTRQRFFQRLRRPSARRQGSYEVAEEQEHQKEQAVESDNLNDQNSQQSRHQKRRTSMISESDETDSADEESTKNAPKAAGPNAKSDVISAFKDQHNRYSTHVKIR